MCIYGEMGAGQRGGAEYPSGADLKDGTNLSLLRYSDDTLLTMHSINLYNFVPRNYGRQKHVQRRS